jgi:hypothetical protein
VIGRYAETMFLQKYGLGGLFHGSETPWSCLPVAHWRDRASRTIRTVANSVNGFYENTAACSKNAVFLKALQHTDLCAIMLFVTEPTPPGRYLTPVLIVFWPGRVIIFQIFPDESPVGASMIHVPAHCHLIDMTPRMVSFRDLFVHVDIPNRLQSDVGVTKDCLS